ncbi:TMEM175 family protein [Amycolatopsis sp. lyj-109]|uniref:TMEM175 family protein n=1 Tax=Amycolatopsis sp. lyj-109 TaxID=2789287 RepID=UPI003978B361
MFVTDAVVAIAITLLVLPLVEAVPDAVAQHLGPAVLISENQWKIYSFLLGFAVIARLWVVHPPRVRAGEGVQQAVDGGEILHLGRLNRSPDCHQTISGRSAVARRNPPGPEETLRCREGFR